MSKPKISKVIAINDLIYNLAGKRPMTELVSSKVFQDLYHNFIRAVEEQVNKKQCGWCLRPVKISHLTTKEKAIFYQSSLCPKCEVEENPSEKTIGLN